MQEFQIVALLGLFFGVSFWMMFRGLIANQRTDILRLQELVAVLRDRLDAVEEEQHQCELARQDALRRLDDYVASNQILMQRNEQLATENGDLRARLSVLSQQLEL